MKIITYNVNGIRSAISKGLLDWMAEEDADVFCFQEVKADEHLIELEVLRRRGYHIFWYSAVKKGYSGLAVISRLKPLSVNLGMGIAEYDAEARIQRLDFEHFSLMNIYVPSGSSGEMRQNFKMRWLGDFHSHIQEILLRCPKLVVCGDFNICHKPIDIHNPVSNKNSSGFLPEEREWLSGFIELGFIDVFRHFNPEPHRYSWWSYRANSRQKNLGWRIDYHMATETLRPQLAGSDILANVIHSDHCPVRLKLASF